MRLKEALVAVETLAIKCKRCSGSGTVFEKAGSRSELWGPSPKYDGNYGCGECGQTGWEVDRAEWNTTKLPGVLDALLEYATAPWWRQLFMR